MSSSDRISCTRVIDASAEKIFSVVTDPNMHVAIDGSGMLMLAPDAKTLTAVGDSFAMDMDREPLGDVPLGKYSVVNTVTRIERDRLLEWNVGAPGRTPIGHVYGYELIPLADGRTEVTSYCDWTNLTEKMRAMVTFPVVPLSMLEATLAKLEALITSL
ncbi:MAG: polyketide cyclase [Acidimicrobiia bacterium]